MDEPMSTLQVQATSLHELFICLRQVGFSRMEALIYLALLTREGWPQ